MFKEISHDQLERFRLIYHQTTGYSNPIIESVLYQNKGGGIYYWGEPISGNYLVFHRSGFGHINFNPFDRNIDEDLFRELDSFVQVTPAIPDYLMLYHTPEPLLNYWIKREKKYFKIRKRRRYQIDIDHFLSRDRSLYAVPPGQELVPLQDCPYADLEKFDLSLDTKFYDSREEFLKNSFGFLLYDEQRRAVSLSYLMCMVGRNSECDLKTL